MCRPIKWTNSRSPRRRGPTLPANISRSPLGYYRACCPALPGCVVLGISRQEAADKLHQAVLAYVAHLETALPRELARLADER